MTTRSILTAVILHLGSSVLSLCAADMPSKEMEKPPVPFAHDAAVGAVAFAPDGLCLVSGCDDGIIRVWNRATAAEVRQLKGHRGRISSLSFSPDGTILASGSGDQTVGLWDVATGKLLQRCQGHDGWVRSVQFSPDGKTVASASFDETVRLWDAATGKELHRFEGHEAPVSAVAFAPDGKSLASCDHDNVSRIWDVATGKPIRSLPKQNRGELTGIAVCGGGRLLVTGAAHGYSSIWNSETGELLQRLSIGGTVLSLTASPDGKLFLAGSGDGNLHLFEVASRQCVLTFPGYQGEWNPLNFYPTTGLATAIQTVAFSSDGSWIAAGTKDGRVRLWRFADLVHGNDKPQKPRPEDLEAIWNDLASADALVGCRALVRLASAPDLALPYLKPRLAPTPLADAVVIRRLLSDLDNDEFTVRERATEELAKYSDSIRPVLREALRGGKLSAEAANRVRQLLERLEGTEPSPEQLRESRLLQCLEWIATPAAKAQLGELAKGQRGSPLTEEAVQALARLGRRARQ